MISISLIVLIAILIAFAIFWLVLYKKEDIDKPAATYACPECNELHCNCYQEKESIKKDD